MFRLSKPALDYREERAIHAVLKSGFLVQGKMVAQFEDVVSKYLGVPNVIAVNSGTSALHLALLALGVGPGDEVIVPDYTFPATANVVELCGAKTVLADIEPITCNVDPKSVERLITSKTKVIMPVHLFGQSADMDPIMKLAKKYRVHVVEDAACSLGGRYKGRFSGTIAEIGCFSFHPRKVITTAEGGVIVASKKSVADKLRILRNHGIEYLKNGVDFVAPGYNYRLTEIQAAMGVVQMSKISKLIGDRRKVAEEYQRQLSHISWLKPVETATYNTHVFQAYVIQVDRIIDRNKLIRYLRENGVESNIGTYAIHRLSYYRKKYNLKPADFPNSEALFNSTVALPFFDTLKRHQISSIVKTLRNFR